MQLSNTKLKKTKPKNKVSIKGKLALATCTLLQAGTPTAQAKSDEWEIDTAFLYYSEADGRIDIFEPVVTASKEINDDELLKFKVVYDVLTGSTPYGALPTNQVQTITNPSGNSNYTTPANELPMNSSFRDTRVAAGVDWTIPYSRLQKITWGANFSNEYDFTSLAGSATYAQDTDDRNRTYSIGVGFTSDKWDPVGGKNTEFAYMIDGESNSPQPKGGTDTKTTTDFMLGLTQVINRSTLMQFNLGYSNSSGYLTDPYRYISLVDGTTGTPLLGAGAPADAFPFLYEKRPDSRTRNTFFWRTVHHLNEDVINVSYRYFTDDWGINSHTVDFRYRYELGNSHYLQPHLRYYAQTAADFYVHSLTAGAALPQYASADYRLGDFVGTTFGLKYGMKTAQNSEFTVRVELMNQTYNTVGTLIGEQNNQDIVPDLNATFLQIGYNFYW